MENQFTRTKRLLGQNAMDRLAAARVAVFGIGGVGGYVCEALVRSGIGAIDIIDKDTVSVSNLNRQIIALRDTVDLNKVDVMEERIHAINPDCKVRKYKCFFLPENAGDFHFEEYDYVVDAIDTVTAKIELVMRCQAAGIPVICSMGTGNKLDPTAFKVADIYRTSVDPLARVMRRELKKRGVKKLKVVFSEETALTPAASEEETAGAVRKDTPGSTAFVPPVAGLILAAEVVRDLTGVKAGVRGV